MHEEFENQAPEEETRAETGTETGTEGEPAAEPAAETTSGKESQPEGGPEDQQQDTPPQSQQPWKNAENRAAAERRREAQEAQRERYFHEFVGNSLINPDTGKPFANISEWNNWKSRAEIAAAAQASGVEDTSAFEAGVRHGAEQARQDLLTNDPEVAGWRNEAMQYRQQAMDAAFVADLKEIRQVYPDEKAKSVVDLGEDFLELRAHGVPNLVAYEALRHQAGRAGKNPSMGDVKPGGGANDFYTRDEVAQMSKGEVEKHFDQIRKSMKKWK